MEGECPNRQSYYYLTTGKIFRLWNLVKYLKFPLILNLDHSKWTKQSINGILWRYWSSLEAQCFFWHCRKYLVTKPRLLSPFHTRSFPKVLKPSVYCKVYSLFLVSRCPVKFQAIDSLIIFAEKCVKMTFIFVNKQTERLLFFIRDRS